MNEERFGQILTALHTEERKMRGSKGKEYASKDMLSFFKDKAEEYGISPLQVWGILFGKSVTSIQKFIKNPDAHHAEPIRGHNSRIGDARNYLGLLDALIEDLGVGDPDCMAKQDRMAYDGCSSRTISYNGTDIVIHQS